uniref:TERF1-interacting nuclear factor 2 N-terminal domain-containing protein n=1 Tax=Salmo trutta TaxID=8032 RepID=A0A674DTH4_SALTR
HADPQHGGPSGASMWQVVQRRDVQDYGMLEEFVTTVTDIVPELLIVKCDYLTVVRVLLQSGDAEVELSESNFVELVESLLKDPSERENFYQVCFALIRWESIKVLLV